MILRLFLIAAGLLCSLPAVAGEEVRVAVASNFAAPLERLRAAYRATGGAHLVIGTASTGQHFAQIGNGAPWDVWLAADTHRPQRLEAAGLAVAGSRFTYAVGRLALVSRPGYRAPAGADTASQLLAHASDERLAIANPRLAPYGEAALETLESMALRESFGARLVLGQNVAQAFALVATGNAELGLVARSLVSGPEVPALGGVWPIAAAAHRPIRQDAVLLRRAADKPQAADFLHWLANAPEAHAIIRRFGYDIAPAAASPNARRHGG